MELYFMVGALVVSVAAAILDLTSRRIPNVLTYTSMLAAIGARGILQGWSGLLGALAGGLIGGGIFLLFFLLRTMGGGDMKLMTAVGCLAGAQKSFEVVLAAAIAGGVMAIAFALWQRRLRTVLVNVADLVRFHFRFGMESHPTLNLVNSQARRLPYGVAIAAGVLYTTLAMVY